MTRDLIMRVAKIDRKAALFMARKVPLLVARGKLTSNFTYEEHLKRLISRNKLRYSFTFCETSQGHKYWMEISNKLGEW